MKFTIKQQRFVEEYLIDFNATQACIRAGYSPKTAYSIGNELLNKPEIQTLVKEYQTKTSEAVQVTKESLINDLLVIKELCLDDKKAIHNSIKAIETINKMLGYNEKSLLDVTTNGKDITPTINVNIIPPKPTDD